MVVITDVCHNETKTISCSNDSVMLIESASYGRMEGTCLKNTEYGHLNCSADVSLYLKRICSGRQSCQLEQDTALDRSNHGCPADLSTYLSVTHHCLERKWAPSRRHRHYKQQLHKWLLSPSKWITTILYNVNQSISKSINQPVSQSINQSINQPVIQSTSQSINQSFNFWINQSINQSAKNNSFIYSFIHSVNCVVFRSFIQSFITQFK